MTADKLADEINDLAESDMPESDKLTEAMKLLEIAHRAIDRLEGEAQDLRDKVPDDWGNGVLDALSDMPADDIGPFLEAGKLAAAEKHGFHSAEYESMDMLTSAITNT